MATAPQFSVYINGENVEEFGLYPRGLELRSSPVAIDCTMPNSVERQFDLSTGEWMRGEIVLDVIDMARFSSTMQPSGHWGIGIDSIRAKMQSGQEWLLTGERLYYDNEPGATHRVRIHVVGPVP